MELDSDLSHCQNAARITQRAFPKLPRDEITRDFRESFPVSHMSLISTKYISLHRTSDVLILMITVAEVFSADPYRYLLSCGMIVFPDLVCLEMQRLSQLLGLDIPRCLLSLDRNKFIALDGLPELCIDR
jgi:hypothetical protein